jgi:putative toxin-antitoxin system antitoxin component (TIGR02293 family)
MKELSTTKETCEKEVELSQLLSELFSSRIEGNVVEYEPPSPKHFISLLEMGVSGSFLRTATQHIPKSVVIDTVGTDATNFSKLTRKKHLNPKQTEGLDDLTGLWRELREFFDWEEASVTGWISRPLPALEGLKPSELMGSQYGRKQVRKILESMKYGDFA